MFVQVIKIEALDKLVAEFGKRHPRFESLLNGILGQHIVHGNMFAHIADKIEEVVLPEPVVVVDHFGRAGAAVEVQELLELGFHTGQIVLNDLSGEQVALFRLSRRITYHACSPANKGYGLVSGLLKVDQGHDLYQVTYMQGIGRRVKADVPCGHFPFQQFFCAGHDVVNHAAPL